MLDFHHVHSELVGPSRVVFHKRRMANSLNHTTGIIKNSLMFAPGLNAPDILRAVLGGIHMAAEPFKSRQVANYEPLPSIHYF